MKSDNTEMSTHVFEFRQLLFVVTGNRGSGNKSGTVAYLLNLVATC